MSFFHLFRPLLFGLIIGRRCDRTWSGPGSNSTHHRQVVSPRSSFTLCQLMCQDFLCLDILYALRVCYTQLAFRKCWFLLKTSLLRDIDSYFCSPWPSSGHFSSSVVPGLKSYIRLQAPLSYFVSSSQCWPCSIASYSLQLM